METARKEYESSVRAYAHVQARSAPVARQKPEPKKPLPPVTIVRDEYWTKLYHAALVDMKEEDAVKFADSGYKCRARSLKIKEDKKKRAPVVLLKPPPMLEQVVNVHKRSEAKCQARTLENRPCPFRASSKCGRFCSKHATTFTMIEDGNKFNECKFIGYSSTKHVENLRKKLGGETDNEWRIKTRDGALVCIFYSKGSPLLKVSALPKDRAKVLLWVEEELGIKLKSVEDYKNLM
ncbi:hypothetical protein EBT31_06790 [bacterium]|nr:hypothetical protein [bacterium]